MPRCILSVGLLLGSNGYQVIDFQIFLQVHVIGNERGETTGSPREITHEGQQDEILQSSQLPNFGSCSTRSGNPDETQKARYGWTA